MPIARTIMTDDDGSGTTGTILNNAWLQTIYGQIDALGGRVAWTPSDVSGAGLAFTVTSANVATIGKIVIVSVNLTYPTNASGAAAHIGGLPFPAVITGGLFTSYGLGRHMLIPAGTTVIQLFNPTTGGQYTNAELSGAPIVASGVYLIA